jgi:hypothetical protein
MADGQVTYSGAKGAATGAGIGASIGAGIASGAAGGSAAGPIGTVVGAIVGLAVGIGSGIAGNVAGKRNAEAQNKINAQYDQFNNESMAKSLERGRDQLAFSKDMQQQNKRRDTINMKARLTDFGEKKERAKFGIQESILNQNRATPASRINRLDRSLLKLKVGNNDTNS